MLSYQFGWHFKKNTAQCSMIRHWISFRPHLDLSRVLLTSHCLFRPFTKNSSWYIIQNPVLLIPAFDFSYFASTEDNQYVSSLGFLLHTLQHIENAESRYRSRKEFGLFTYGVRLPLRLLVQDFILFSNKDIVCLNYNRPILPSRGKENRIEMHTGLFLNVYSSLLFQR